MCEGNSLYIYVYTAHLVLPGELQLHPIFRVTENECGVGDGRPETPGNREIDEKKEKSCHHSLLLPPLHLNAKQASVLISLIRASRNKKKTLLENGKLKQNGMSSVYIFFTFYIFVSW